MRRLLSLSLLLIIPIALSACGGGGGGASTTSQDISVAGGTVSLGNNVTLRIPPGALAAPAKVTITKKNAPGDALPGGQSLGNGYNIDLGGQTLAKPVTLEIAFDPKKLPQGSPAETAFAAYHDDTKNTWVPVGGTIDTQRNVIVIQTDHLSWWNPFSWNWDAWIAVLHDTLSSKLSDWVNAAHLLTQECQRTGQHANVDESKANKIVQGCVVAGDAAHPRFRVVNVKSFYIGLSPAAGGPGYPEASILGPGEAKEFTASAGDQPPAVVNVDFTDAAMWRFIVGLCAEMLPAGDQLTNEGVNVIADGLSRVASASDVSQALDDGNAKAAADAVFALMTGDSFLQTFTQLAAQFGSDHGIDMLTRWTTSSIKQVFLGVAATSVIISTTDFLANYIFNYHSQVAFSWVQLSPTSTPKPFATPRSAATGSTEREQMITRNFQKAQSLMGQFIELMLSGSEADIQQAFAMEVPDSLRYDELDYYLDYKSGSLPHASIEDLRTCSHQMRDGEFQRWSVNPDPSWGPSRVLSETDRLNAERGLLPPDRYRMRVGFTYRVRGGAFHDFDAGPSGISVWFEDIHGNLLIAKNGLCFNQSPLEPT